MTSTTCQLAQGADRPDRHAVSSCSVAGAVLRSARRSARISQARLAAACGVTEKTMRAWENGSSPLTSVPMRQVESLIVALHEARACRLLTADLVVAAWCDLIITTVAASEDVTCLLADPITADDAFGELMAWSLDGHVPQRHRLYATAGPLFSDQTVIERVRQVLGWAWE